MCEVENNARLERSGLCRGEIAWRPRGLTFPPMILGGRRDREGLWFSEGGTDRLAGAGGRGDPVDLPPHVLTVKRPGPAPLWEWKKKEGAD